MLNNSEGKLLKTSFLVLSRFYSGWLGVRCQRLKFHLKKRSSYLINQHFFNCKFLQVAVYWLLRAAEQGEGEAQETLVALAGEGRGLTEQNYVDVAAVVRVAPNVAQGQFLGRTLFRTLSRGQVETFP